MSNKTILNFVEEAANKMWKDSKDDDNQIVALVNERTFREMVEPELRPDPDKTYIRFNSLKTPKGTVHFTLDDTVPFGEFKFFRFQDNVPTD